MAPRSLKSSQDVIVDLRNLALNQYKTERKTLIDLNSITLPPKDDENYLIEHQKLVQSKKAQLGIMKEITNLLKQAAGDEDLEYAEDLVAKARNQLKGDDA